MDVVIQVGYFLLSLSLLIILHELGHFIPAKLFKTRVEKFYLFFDPWFSLFKFKRNGTEYGIGWLPLGGYVKIAGMIDESMDKEQMKKPAQPWEFRSKPAWQRLIIMIGGVTVNFILAFAIYIGIMAVWGDAYLPNKNVQYGVVCDSIALEMGLQHGDKIVSVNGKEINDFFEISSEVLLNDPDQMIVERNGEIVQIPLYQEYINEMIKTNRIAFVSPRYPLFVDRVLEQSAAEAMGLQAGDKILTVDGKETIFYDQFVGLLSEKKGDLLQLAIEREGEQKSFSFVLPMNGKVGIGFQNFDNFLALERREYSLLEAVPVGVQKALSTTGKYFKQFKLIFNKDTEAYKSLGGFDSIRKLYPSSWNWEQFWTTTAFISLILAIMNLLPIPALDGGHVMFLLYEIFTGRKPNEKVMEYAQMVGMLLLLSLLLLVNGNDVMKYFNF